MTGFAATAVLVSFFLTPLMGAWSVRRGLLDRPNERSSHTVPTPRSGGKAMVVALVCAIAVSWVREAFIAIAVATSFFTLSGVLDDLRGLKPLPKFLLQLMGAATFVILSQQRIYSIDFGAFAIPIGPLAVVATIFWLIGFTNFFNFMDGVNGIAASQTIVSGVVLALLALRDGDAPTVIIALSIAGVAAGFLPWNLTGRIFMGDTGSATLGFLLAVCAVNLRPQSFVRALLPMLPFLFDTLLTLAMRLAQRQRVSEAHRSHLYQRLTDLGWLHHGITLLYTALAAIGGAAALMSRSVLLPLSALLITHASMAAAILTRHRRVTALRQRASAAG